MFMFRKITALFLCGLLMASCSENNREEDKAPWGNDTEDELFDLDEILSSGGMIAVTLNGPDTYYDYRGRKSGTQYLLCEKFARHIGAPVRMEVCRDTAELIKKVEEGSADIIACTIDKAYDKNNVLEFCGVSIKGRGQWAVNRHSSVLADSLNAWFTPSLITEIENEQRYRMTTGKMRCKPQPQILDRRHGIISKYDNLFRRHAATAGFDWHLLAAQSYQESCFDPNARSWMGACGLMQIMPGTAEELNLSKGRIFNPAENVSAAVRYLAKLQRKFADITSPEERIKFVLASYNGGYLHIRDAMALAEKNGRNSKLWSEVSRYVLLLAHPRYYNDRVVKYGYMRGSETVDYVKRIHTRWAQYKGIEPKRPAQNK